MRKIDIRRIRVDLRCQSRVKGWGLRVHTRMDRLSSDYICNLYHKQPTYRSQNVKSDTSRRSANKVLYYIIGFYEPGIVRHEQSSILK